MSRAGHPPVHVCLLERLQQIDGYVRSADLIAAVWTARGLDVPWTAGQVIRREARRLRVEGHVIISMPGRNSPGFWLRRPSS